MGISSEFVDALKNLILIQDRLTGLAGRLEELAGRVEAMEARHRRDLDALRERHHQEIRALESRIVRLEAIWEVASRSRAGGEVETGRLDRPPGRSGGHGG